VAHPLDSAKAQTERAEEQIDRLYGELEAFFKLNPYRLVSEPNPDTPPGGYGLLIRGYIDREPPIRLRVLIGEIIHNMRVALDHLVWALVIANGRTGNRNTGFPVCDSPHEYETNGLRKVKRAAAAAQALIESLQPYQGGKHVSFSPLYRLHHLDRIHKHRALHVIACAVELRKLWVERSWYESVPGAERTMNIKIPRVKPFDGAAVVTFQNGAEILRITSSVDVKMQQEIALGIAFDEPGVVQGQTILPTLYELLTFTSGVIDAFAFCFSDPV
jgi:hypothetical protein